MTFESMLFTKKKKKKTFESLYGVWYAKQQNIHHPCADKYQQFLRKSWYRLYLIAKYGR